MALRAHAVTVALVAAGLVCTVMMQRHAAADVGGAVTRGLPEAEVQRRRLASTNEYDQAMRSVGQIVNETSATAGGRLPLAFASRAS